MRLIHFTLKEYLSAHPNILNRPHSTIAEICLTYLNSQEVNALTVDSYSDTIEKGNSFLRYCSLHWGVHVKMELSDCAKSLSLELLSEYNGHISGKIIFSKLQLRIMCIPTDYQFSGLHCASLFGIVEVVAALIEMECCGINEEDRMGYTPLTWAARNGHEEVVKILLEREEVNPNKPDIYGHPPLSYAAGFGHEGVVKILLGREEVDPDKPGNDGRTPLAHASNYGEEGVVKILLRREEVNPDKPDEDGRTPLSHAAQYGYKGVVKILLECEEVNPDKPDNNGRTPLSHAAKGGREGVAGFSMVRPVWS